MIWLWTGILLVAVLAAHWGAEHLSEPLKKLRKQWGFSVTAGGALIGLATASPEIGINITSAARGVTDIGLGAMIGANIIALPLLIAVAYMATRKEQLGGDHVGHERHLREHLLQIDSQAATVQVLPYLGILAVFACLTLPTAWRGLQPIDGWIMVAAYLVYLAQALLRGRRSGESVDWSRHEILLALAGVVSLAIGAYFTVFSTEKVVSALGLSGIVGGLFITAPVAALPEIFATWSVSRSGHPWRRRSPTTHHKSDRIQTIRWLRRSSVLSWRIPESVKLLPSPYPLLVLACRRHHPLSAWLQ